MDGRTEIWTIRDTLVLVVLSVGTALLYLVSLSQPSGFVYDEVFYVPRACEYQGTTSEGCDLPKLEARESHPPLGTWMIAAGGWSMGNGPWGWRFFPAVAGICTVSILYVLARHLRLSVMAAVVSSLLLALDFMHFVNSRAGVLDVFVPFFGTAAFLCVWMDHARRTSGVRRVRMWLPLAGISLGLAVASKWSGAFAIFGTLVLAVWCATRRERLTNAPHPLDQAIRDRGTSFMLNLIVVPVFVYMTTYIGRLDGSLLAIPWGEGSWLRSFWDQQLFMYRFHSSYVFVSNIRSPAWSWPLLKRPMTYYYEPTQGGGVRWIVATGNPLVWWPGMAAVLYCTLRWLRDRSSVNSHCVVAIGFVASYLLWFPMSAYRTVWISYFLPAIPFMCLAMGFAIDRLARWRPGRPLVLAYVGAVVASFVFFYPVLTGAELSAAQRDRRVLFEDCDSRGWSVEIRGPDGPEARVLDSGQPPEGWCWGEARPS